MKSKTENIELAKWNHQTRLNTYSATILPKLPIYEVYCEKKDIDSEKSSPQSQETEQSEKLGRAVPMTKRMVVGQEVAAVVVMNPP